MKIAGFFLLLSGWFLVLAALVLLKPGVSLNIFVLAAVAVQMVGLILVARSHPTVRGDRG